MNQSVYLALDFPSWEETKQFLQTNQLNGVPVKVGMELFYREGPKVIENLRENNHSIFLDLKLHDIPTTVMKAMRSISKLDVEMVNVHALGGAEMIKRAKEGLTTGHPNKTKLIAVTILTSMDKQTMNNELLLPGEVDDKVSHFAHFSQSNGVDGVVCSVYEAEKIKVECGDNFLTVTPGIRLGGTEVNDQKRIATPAYAKSQGTDYIVVGRSITNAENPKKAYERVVEEWTNGSIV
ncbi:orotidine-5'-phosphate decarboxylase [Oceanobacillus manasiensis]|uniref:orotidine-5'-phosphate decarboxylase n=1 Tax=Oceanobacillus manasiensis TaxID=586413 RepID=UPI0005A8B5FD|nr:orotidine-5'-phosphate decarboxylase [Oceanobacillus manasiensis]